MPLTVIVHRPEWPTLGTVAAEWIERFLCHGPGDVQGEPFRIDNEEQSLLEDLYRLYPPGHPREGRRVVTRALYSRSKGRRKSELAGALVCFEALGDARFHHWGARRGHFQAVDGRPVLSPFIRCLATEEEQTGNTYDNVIVMLNHALDQYSTVFAGIDVGMTRTFLPDGGEIRPSTASSAAKDGGKESFAVADEEHLLVSPELKRMHRTVSRNLVKRKAAEPWLLGTTTMFRLGEGSTAEITFEHAEKVAAGKAREAGFYFNHREGTAVGDWESDEQVLASLREAYGEAATWMDLDRVLDGEIRNPEADPADSARYFLNQRHQGAESVFDIELWRSLATPAVTIGDKEKITLGFDGARFQDSTALVATHVETGYQWVVGLWERPVELSRADAWEVDEIDVNATVDEAFDTWRVVRFYADPPYWEDTIDAWAGRRGTKRVYKWWTARLKPTAYAIRAFATAQRARDVSHDGDSRYAAQIGNARKWPTRILDDEGRQMFTMRKEHPQSTRKIDCAMAGTLSWEARGDAIALGALRKPARTGRAQGF